ncbi:MAG: 3-hydroxyacyl-CoA dehydrogenase NAD-binding domain-containing protein, partial [Planctomycetota bacterium]
MSGSANTVGILGAGTMGAGIAQVAAASGWTVHLADVNEATVRTAIDGISKRFDRLVEKGKLTAGQRDEAIARLKVATEPASFASCHVVVEAVVEDLDVKVAVVRTALAELSDDAIIASNTSSLSI